MKTIESEHIALVKEFYKAIAEGNFEYAHTLLDPNIEWVEPAAPGLFFSGPHHGRPSVLDEIIRPTRNQIHEFKWKAHKFFAVGETVIAMGREMGHSPVTSAKLRAPMAHVWTVRMGALARCEAIRDLAQWREFLGQTAVWPQRMAA